MNRIGQTSDCGRFAVRSVGSIFHGKRRSRRPQGGGYRALLLALLFLAGRALATPPLEEKFEKVLPISAKAEVSIENTDGSIYLYGSEVPELKISARKKAYSKERLEAIGIEVRVDGDKVLITTHYPPTPEGLSLKDRSGTVDYEILVPETASIRVLSLRNGEIILSGLRGPKVHARLTNGILSAIDCFTALQLTAEQGAIDVSYNWWETGAVGLFASLGQGNLRVALPPDPSVRLDAASISGQITNQFGQEYGQGDSRSLRTTIGAEGGAEFKLRTSSGNIRIERSY